MKDEKGSAAKSVKSAGGAGNAVGADGKPDLTPVAKVFFTLPGGHKEPFFGPGMTKLLRCIKDTGNVRKASALMEVSYSKCWKLLATGEKCFGEKLVDRRHGGAHGGEASLTEKGELVLKNYTLFHKECNDAVAAVFKKYFG